MNILVWVETDGGSARKVSKELLSEAARRAESDGLVLAVVLGEGARDVAQAEKGLADTWFVSDAGALASYDLPAWAAAIRNAVETAEAGLVLGGASVRGRELFSALSAEASWALAPEIVRLESAGDGFRAVRPVLGGRALQSMESSARPFLATVRPNTYAYDPGLAGRAGDVKDLGEPVPGPASGKVRYTGVEKKGGERPPLTEAEIVVAGGRGLKKSGNFHLVEELADALGAAVGASRAIVDAGWRDISEQVGKSGLTVSPRLYIAAGISGAIHHLMGMDTAKVVVAVDKDPEAPIFLASDYGIAGDALEVLPAITKAVKEAS